MTFLGMCSDFGLGGWININGMRLICCKTAYGTTVWASTSRCETFLFCRQGSCWQNRPLTCTVVQMRLTVILQPTLTRRIYIPLTAVCRSLVIRLPHGYQFAIGHAIMSEVTKTSYMAIITCFGPSSSANRRMCSRIAVQSIHEPYSCLSKMSLTVTVSYLLFVPIEGPTNSFRI